MRKTYDSLKAAVSECSAKYKYALVYMMSRLVLGEISEISLSDCDEILEARFFDENGEEHICIEDGETVSYGYSDSESAFDGSDVKSIRICSEFSSRYKKIKVKKYYSFDEDGQICTVLTRCCGLEG